jgi:tetratricopeptide (TPR) repeat protein
MLAQALGPEPFAEMLKSLANKVNNRVIDTRTFFNSIEHMSGANLEQFERRFVYGTGIPEVYYTYKFVEQDDGTWTIVGEARQVTPGRFDYVLQKTDGVTWHVARKHTADVDVEQSAIAVPFQIALAARKDEHSEVAWAGGKTTTQRGLGGRLVLQGERTEFSIPIPERPEKFWFDQRGEVLVSMYSELEEPKRMLRYRAIELANAKRFGEAEELYRKALGAPLYSEAAKDPPSKKDIERNSKTQDALIHIALTRMYIDMERDAEASTELGRADALLVGRQKNYYEISRMVLHCHLAVRAGDYQTAYRDMEKSVYLKFPFRYQDSMGASSRRRKFGSRGRFRLDGLGYALFAVAAHETGKPEVARQAAKEATKRGAIMTPLEELLDADS